MARNCSAYDCRSCITMRIGHVVEVQSLSSQDNSRSVRLHVFLLPCTVSMIYVNMKQIHTAETNAATVLGQENVKDYALCEPLIGCRED